MLVLAYVMLLIGTAACLWHILYIRPSPPWQRWLVVNGFPGILLLWYVRAIVLLVESGGAGYVGHVGGGGVFRVVSGLVIDALVVLRVKSYIRYRRAYNRRARELAADTPAG